MRSQYTEKMSLYVISVSYQLSFTYILINGDNNIFNIVYFDS